ncbi:hypothetical protein TNCV_3457731 [Trichonephila clavipes]|nr:hypothetical protein TNCV_3457731 [Trichonephila clavipes]
MQKNMILVREEEKTTNHLGVSNGFRFHFPVYGWGWFLCYPRITRGVPACGRSGVFLKALGCRGNVI